jgi:antirestriction protein ArdC
MTSLATSSTPKTRPDVYGVITERVCALLDAGPVPWRKSWRSAEALPTNLVSQKAYRGVNVFLLGCTPFGSPYWHLPALVKHLPTWNSGRWMAAARQW